MLKLRNHFLLALSFFALTLLQQYLFYLIKDRTIIWLPLPQYLGYFVFFFITTFCKGPRTRFVLLSLMMILNLFQMGHLSYFGTQILPSGIYLFFTQFSEAQGTLKEELYHVMIPFFMTIIPLALAFQIQKKIKTHFEWLVIPVLIFSYLSYNPLRTYLTGNTWGRQPSTNQLDGMNVYLSLSYFLGKILPNKFKTEHRFISNRSMELKLTPLKKDPEWDKIIVVLGESLNPNHMSLLGYHKPTTPFLSSLKNDQNFHATIGLSSGVSTDISVSFFLNMGYGHAGALKASKGKHCLFKLAKAQKFSTYFFSNQSKQQLRYIIPYLCLNSLDQLKFLEGIAPHVVDENAASDLNLLKPLTKILADNDKQFIILNQRGSHSPWNLRYSPNSKKFLNVKEPRVTDYDNSVVEFDHFWKEFHEVLKIQKKKILVVYLSDHGEALGEDGRWGHGFLSPHTFEIPMMFKTYNKDLPENVKKMPRFFPQYNLGILLTQEMGYHSNQDAIRPASDFVVFGNDIDGFAGRATIHFDTQGQYQFKIGY